MAKEINHKSELEQDPILKCIPWEVWQYFFDFKINEEALEKIKTKFFPQDLKCLQDPAPAIRFLSEINLDEEELSFNTRSSFLKERKRTFLFLLYFYPNIGDEDWLNLARDHEISASQLIRLCTISGRKALLESLINHSQIQKSYYRTLNFRNDDWHASFCLAATYGHLNLLEYLFQLFPQQKKQLLKANKYDAFSCAAATGKTRVLQFFLAEADSSAEREAMLSNEGSFKALSLASKNKQTRTTYFILSALSRSKRRENHLGSTTHPVLSKQAISSIEFKKYSSRISAMHLKSYPEKDSKAFLQRLDSLISSGNTRNDWFKSLCNDIESFQILTANDPRLHILIMKKLLSSTLGLRLFYHLLEAGFDAFANLNPEHKDLMQHHIYAAGSSDAFCFTWNNPSSCKDFLTQLDVEIKTLFTQSQREPLEPKMRKRLFHGAFILGFLDLHNQAPKKSLELIRYIQANYLIDEFIVTGKPPESAYQLARASGFSFSQLKGGLRILLNFSQKKPKISLQKSFFLFIIEHYLDNTPNLFDPALIIALKVTEEWIEKDLRFDFPSLNQSLKRHYENYLDQNSKELSSEALVIRSSFQLQKIFALILAALKRQNQNITEPLLLLETFTQHLQTIKTYDHLILINIQDNESLFAPSLKRLKTCLAKKKFFYDFLTYFDDRLSLRLASLPILDFESNPAENLKFNLIEAPNEKSFMAWKNLPRARKNLYHAMDNTLTELEEEHGYRGPWPLYYGYIPKKIANKDIFFRECPRHLPGLLHGKDSHRIQLAALRFFIKRGYLHLPPNKTAHELLLHIIEAEQWNNVFDQFEESFSCPEFLMLHLRSQLHFKFLRIHALFSFFKGMNKILKLYQDLEYKDLLLLIPTGLSSSLTEEPFKAWLTKKAYPCQRGHHEKGEFYARYFKSKPKTLDRKIDEISPKLSSSI